MAFNLFVTPNTLETVCAEAAKHFASVLQEVGGKELNAILSLGKAISDDDPFADVDPKLFASNLVFVVAVPSQGTSLRCTREVRGASRNDIPTFVIYSGDWPTRVFSTPTICIESVEFENLLMRLIKDTQSFGGENSIRSSFDESQALRIADKIREQMPVARSKQILEATLEMSEDAMELIEAFESKIGQACDTASKDASFLSLHAGVECIERKAHQIGYLRSTTDVCSAFDRTNQTAIRELYAIYAELRPRLIAATTTHRDVTEAAQQVARWRVNVEAFVGLATGRLLELHGIPSPLTDLDQVRKLFAVRETQIHRALDGVVHQIQEDFLRMRGWASKDFSENRELAQMVQRLLKLVDSRVECSSCGKAAGIRCTQNKPGSPGVFQFSHTNEGHRSTNHAGSMVFPALSVMSHTESQNRIHPAPRRKVA